MSFETKNLKRAGVLLALTLAFSACGGRDAKILSNEDPDLVDLYGGGIATFDQLIAQAVPKLLTRETARTPGLNKRRIAFVGMVNKSAEPLNDMRHHAYGLINGVIERSDRYRPVDRDFVDAALTKILKKPKELYLPENRRAFAEALEMNETPIQYLLFATVTSATSRGNDIRQRNYSLELKLVNIETGDHDIESGLVRKTYE